MKFLQIFSPEHPPSEFTQKSTTPSLLGSYAGWLPAYADTSPPNGEELLSFMVFFLVKVLYPPPNP